MDSENLSAHPYSLLPALKEGFFADITFIASNSEKVFILSITLLYWLSFFYFHAQFMPQ